MIRVRCPKCHKLLGLDDTAAGAMGQCPACEETFRIPPAGTDESRPAPAVPTVLQPADDDEEEVVDAQVAEEAPEWGRDAPRERKRRRRRRRQPDMPTPSYMEERDEADLGPLGALGNLKRIFGIVLMGMGLLSICGGWATSMSEAAGKSGPAGICGGIVLGAVFIAVGLFLVMQGD
jgi:hypothetical protein